METSRGTSKLFNGPEAFTPDGEFILGESGGRVLGGRRVLRTRLAGAGGMGWQMADGSSTASPASTCGTGHPPLRPPVPQPGLRAGARDRGLLDLLRHQVPQPRAAGGAAAEALAGLPRLAELGAWFGEKSGWERANWFDPNAAPATRRCGRTAGPASTGRPRSMPRRGTREGAGLFDESSFAKIEVRGPGRPRPVAAAVRERRRPPVGRSPTPRC